MCKHPSDAFEAFETLHDMIKIVFNSAQRLIGIECARDGSAREETEETETRE